MTGLHQRSSSQERRWRAAEPWAGHWVQENRAGEGPSEQPLWGLAASERAIKGGDGGRGV